MGNTENYKVVTRSRVEARGEYILVTQAALLGGPNFDECGPVDWLVTAPIPIGWKLHHDKLHGLSANFARIHNARFE
jgi:hypothetical protein